MTPSDLLFVLLVLVSLVTTLFAGVLALLGRRARALAILRRVALGAAVYLGLVALVSVFVPRCEVGIGEPLCFDDWCIAVEGVRAWPSGDGYEVDLRLSSRARGVPQSEHGVFVYLVDEAGARHDPVPDAAAVSLETRLAPGESVLVTRRFVLPGASPRTLVVGHGGFPIRWFLLGEGPFRGPPRVRLERAAGPPAGVSRAG